MHAHLSGTFGGDCDHRHFDRAFVAGGSGCPRGERADFVMVHVPHGKQTHHLINAEVVGKMRPSSYLINTSRGAVLDEPALVRALSDGTIAGAGLDVFDKEPPEPDNPLLSLTNVILTPHSAALTKQCVARMAVDAAQGVLDVLQGRKPKYAWGQAPHRR